eukprot:scaffold8863_cov112-Isochrysis_galbana.AAC.2
MARRGWTEHLPYATIDDRWPGAGAPAVLLRPCKLRVSAAVPQYECDRTGSRGSERGRRDASHVTRAYACALSFCNLFARARG